MLVNINYLKASKMKKNTFTSILISILLITISSCADEKPQNDLKIKIYPSESTIVVFDRLVELKQDPSLQAKFEKFEFYKHLSYPGLIFPDKFTEEIYGIIKLEKSHLLLGEKESLIWGQVKKGFNSLFLVDPSREANLGSDLLSSAYNAEKKELTLELSSAGTELMQKFLLKNLNRNILIECNGKIISVLEGIGEYKSGELVIKNVQLD